MKYFPRYLEYFRILFLDCLDTLVQFLPSPRAAASKKKLLIVKPDAIGDFIIFLDSLKEYKNVFPAENWEITLVGNVIWKDLAEPLPYADNKWFYHRKEFDRNFLYRLSFLKKIKDYRFDLVIHPVYSREYHVGDKMVRASCANERIGFVGDLGNMPSFRKKISDKWYTRLIKTESFLELERLSEFLSKISSKSFLSSPPSYPLEFLNPYNNSMSTKYFVLAPGSAWPGRRWPLELFSKLVVSIRERTGWTPVICGSADERQIAEKIMELCPDIGCINLAGKTSLSDIVFLLNKAEITVSNETSAIHIAAATGCPSICILGGGHFGRFFPYGDTGKNRVVFKKMDCFGCGWNCIYDSVRCIEEITFHMVWEEVSELLETSL